MCYNTSYQYHENTVSRLAAHLEPAEEEIQVQGRNLSPRILTGALISVFFAVALLIRVYLPFDRVFVGDWIKFTSADSYYYMRLVDNMAANFPHINTFDPYFIYPGGGWLNTFQFFNWLVAGVAWVIGLGEPSQRLVDIVGVYFPAMLGALAVIPVFFIGKALFNRWVGVLSAAAIAIIAGEFMGRSILGYTDQHIAESLFTTVAMLFLILAIKEARRRELTFSHVRQQNWAILTRPLVYSLLAGFFLGIYLITWAGALMFGFVITLYFIIQFIIDHLNRQSTDYLCFTGVIVFLLALVILAPIRPAPLYLVALIAALLIPAILNIISRVTSRKATRPVFYPLLLVGLGAVVLVAFRLIAPDLFRTMVGLFSIFAPTGAMAVTTMEMQPLLKPDGTQWSLSAAWGNFAYGSYISIAVLIFLIILSIRQSKAGKADNGILLFLVWSLVMTAATLGQRRFAYYLAINVAILTGYFSWMFLSFSSMLTDWLFGQIRTVDFKVRLASLSGVSSPVADAKAKRDTIYRGDVHILKYVFKALAVIAVFLFAYYFNIPNSVAVAQQARFAPSNSWYSAMDWLRTNTPEPFGDPAFYYKPYEDVPRGTPYPYPESAYGVTSWWDYGYLITRMGHRLPNANPGQDPDAIANVGRFLLSQENSPPAEIMAKLDSSYVAIDYAMATSKFWAIVEYSGQKAEDYFEAYYLVREGKLVPVLLFYPAYYNTICTRLYNFDNKDVTTVHPIVVAYEKKTARGGTLYKQITTALEFDSYQEAQDYVRSQTSGNFAIVGADQFTSPVPLKSLEDYKVAFSSTQSVSLQDSTVIPDVKIFEYTGSRN